MSRRFWAFGTAAGLALTGVMPAAAQQPAATVTVNGRVQFQWNTTSVDTAEAGTATPIPSSTFETRRTRIETNITVSDWITGMLEVDVALARLTLKNVWMALEFDPALVVRAGHFKKPFSLLELSSSTRLAVIERGVRIRGLEQALAVATDHALPVVRGSTLAGELYALITNQNYGSYDMGVELAGSYRALGWAAGVFNGSGADVRDDNDAKAWAARLTVSPSPGLPLRFGAAWSHTELNWPSATSVGRRRGSAVELDAELGGFRNGPWVLAEVARGENLASGESFIGAQGIASYFFPTGGRRFEGIEPVARVSWGDPDDRAGDDAGLLFTPGINLYFFGRNRLMFNWDVYMAQDDRIATHHAARAQLNLHF